jgi:hypothetical protein
VFPRGNSPVMYGGPALRFTYVCANQGIDNSSRARALQAAHIDALTGI